MILLAWRLGNWFYTRRRGALTAVALDKEPVTAETARLS